jgi:hypothetical protein
MNSGTVRINFCQEFSVFVAIRTSSQNHSHRPSPHLSPRYSGTAPVTAVVFAPSPCTWNVILLRLRPIYTAEYINECIPETTNKEGFHLRLAVNTIQPAGIRRLLVAEALSGQGSSCRSSGGLAGLGQVSPRITGPSQFSMMQLTKGPLEVEVPTDTGSTIRRINKLGNVRRR